MPWEKSFDIPQTLNKAMKTFWSHGYEATSVQDLVDAMGINRGSMYATFGDKRTLFIATLRLYSSDFRKALLMAVERKHSGKAAIRALFEFWVENNAKDPDHCGCFLTNTALELSAHDAEICALVAESQIDIEDFLQRQIIQGQKAGEIPRERNATELARAMLAMLLGMLVLCRSRPDTELLQAIADGATAALA